MAEDKVPYKLVNLTDKINMNNVNSCYDSCCQDELIQDALGADFKSSIIDESFNIWCVVFIIDNKWYIMSGVLHNGMHDEDYYDDLEDVEPYDWLEYHLRETYEFKSKLSLLVRLSFENNIIPNSSIRERVIEELNSE